MTKNPTEGRPERRSHPRQRVHLPVGIGLQTEEHQAETLNVSQSGILCLLHEPVPLFTKVSVNLDVTKDVDQPRNVLCNGIIVRQEEVEREGECLFETAVFFQGLSDKEAIAITSYLGHDKDA